MPALDYHWIVPNLAQGSFPRPPELAFQTFDVIAFCAEEMQPRIKAPAGKQLFRLPLDDDPYRPLPPEVQQILHKAAYALARQLASGRRVLVTCAAGLNRSGMLNALVLMHGYRMRAKDAITLIRRKRHADALCNPMFEQFLLNTKIC